MGTYIILDNFYYSILLNSDQSCIFYCDILHFTNINFPLFLGIDLNRNMLFFRAISSSSLLVYTLIITFQFNKIYNNFTLVALLFRPKLFPYFWSLALWHLPSAYFCSVDCNKITQNTLTRPIPIPVDSLMENVRKRTWTEHCKLLSENLLAALIRFTHKSAKSPSPKPCLPSLSLLGDAWVGVSVCGWEYLCEK